MSTVETASTRVAQKRKISEQPEGSGPSAKRAKNDKEDENEGGTGERDATRENAYLQKPGEPGSNPKDRKKRRKKKRKISVVQQNGAVPHAAVEPSSPVQVRSKPPSNTPTSVQKDGTAGRSRASPTPSVASDRARTPVSALTRQSVTPSRTMLSASDKGKGRATTPSMSSRAIEADAKALTAHRSLLSNMLPSLTCQICLLLMSRPFALAPCGHVSCHSCLVSWFSNEPGTLGQAISQAEPPRNEAGPNPEGPAANGNAAAPPLPPPPPPIVRRKKTCPQCRAVVREKPAEVWSIKDMVGAVVRSGLADPESVPLDLREGAGTSGDASTADPWKDIFRSREAPDVAPFGNLMMREHMGIRDDEDGGVYRCVDCTHEIWDGVCSSCGRVYLGHRLDFDSDSQDDDIEQLWMHSDLDDEDDIDHLNFFRHLVDAENLGEIGLGPHDLDDDEDDDGNTDDDGSHIHIPRPPRWLDFSVEGGDLDEDSHSSLSGSDASGNDDEEGYESSFIDDDNDGDDDVIEIPRPPSDVPQNRPPRQSARRLPQRHAPVIVVSSDEDNGAAGSMDDETGSVDAESIEGDVGDSDEGGDDDLAAEVAAREQELYGDDGSLPPRHMRRYQPEYIESDDDDEGDY